MREGKAETCLCSVSFSLLLTKRNRLSYSSTPRKSHYLWLCLSSSPSYATPLSPGTSLQKLIKGQTTPSLFLFLFINSPHSLFIDPQPPSTLRLLSSLFHSLFLHFTHLCPLDQPNNRSRQKDNHGTALYRKALLRHSLLPARLSPLHLPIL